MADSSAGVYLLAGAVLGAPDGTPGLLLSGHRIQRLLSRDEAPPPGASVEDHRPHLIAPGTLDVHTHGAVECSFSSGPPEDTLAICRYRATTGSTGLLATITGEWNELLAALQKLGRLTGHETGGAALLGIHVEGPFINPVRKGAISESTLRPPSLDDLQRMQDAAGGAIKMMTVAPEVPGALPVVEAMVRLGIVPSAGHTDASYGAMLDGIRAGVCKTTHTFNAMPPLHHREPGALGAILADDRIVAEVIPDGAHVHPAVVAALVRAKTPGRVTLVTDGIRYAGLPDGVYERPGRGRASVTGGLAIADDGTIAGSVSPMDRNLHVLRKDAGISTEDAFTMGALVPARLLGLDDRGRIEPGARADLAVYDSDLRCLATYVSGRRVHAAAA